MTAIIIWMRLFLKFDQETIEKLTFDRHFFLLSILQAAERLSSEFFDCWRSITAGFEYLLHPLDLLKGQVS